MAIKRGYCRPQGLPYPLFCNCSEQKKSFEEAILRMSLNSYFFNIRTMKKYLQLPADTDRIKISTENQRILKGESL
jgi:hypothetical protein